jgi:hypothetical protein
MVEGCHSFVGQCVRQHNLAVLFELVKGAHDDFGQVLNLE